LQIHLLIITTFQIISDVLNNIVDIFKQQSIIHTAGNFMHYQI